jgi:hypothetical protein
MPAKKIAKKPTRKLGYKVLPSVKTLSKAPLEACPNHSADG